MLITTIERTQTIEEIDELINLIYHTDQTAIDILHNHISSLSSELIRPFLDHHHVDLSNPQAVHHALQDLRIELVNKQEVPVTLAFQPGREFLQKLHESFQSLLKIDNHLLKLRISPSIVGGVIFIYNGHYYDYSLKTKLEAFYTQQKHDILQLLQQ